MILFSAIPKVTYRPPIKDIFSNFDTNWTTLSPVLWILYGTLFGFFVLQLIIKHYKND